VDRFFVILIGKDRHSDEKQSDQILDWLWTCCM